MDKSGGMIQWYYARGGQQQGPVSIEELRALAQSGQLGAQDMVWNSSMADWLPAGTVGGIIGAASANPYATPGSAWVAAEPAMQLGSMEEIPPGSDPIGVMDCLGKAFELTKKHFLILFLTFLIFLGISIVLTLPFTIVSMIEQMKSMPVAQTAPPSFETLFSKGMEAQFTPLYFVEQALWLVIASFLMGGLSRILLNLTSGQAASVGQIFSQWNKMPRILGVMVLLSIPTWVGLAVLAVTHASTLGSVVYFFLWLTSMFLWLRFGFASTAIVDRNMGLADAFKYSYSISRNNGFRLLGLYILIFIFIFLGALPCGLGLVFVVPLAMMSGVVAYRWLQYGRRVLAI